MHKTIRVPDLERNFRTVLEEVKREHIPFVLTEDSRPEAVLVPYGEFLKLQRFQEEKVLARFDELWRRMAEQNAGFTEEEVSQDIDAAKTERSAQ
jgi:prevent-host-death family protein